MDSRFVDLPIIALSAHAMAEERERCQLLGMNGHLSKPIDPERLYEVLADFRGAARDMRPGPKMPNPEARQRKLPLPDMPGINVAAGLHHTDGKQELYLRLLRDFAKSYSTFGKEMACLLQGGEPLQMAAPVHTLKGLAATLGAFNVEQAATALERAIQAVDAAGIRTALELTANHLDVVIGGIKDHLLPTPASGEGDKSRYATGDPSRWLPKFCELLRQADVEACQLWESRQSSIGDQLPRETIIAVSDALARFEFDLALLLITESRSEHIGTSTELQ
jgi:CheY-like chemotaxis protein